MPFTDLGHLAAVKKTVNREDKVISYKYHILTGRNTDPSVVDENIRLYIVSDDDLGALKQKFAAEPGLSPEVGGQLIRERAARIIPRGGMLPFGDGLELKYDSEGVHLSDASPMEITQATAYIPQLIPS